MASNSALASLTATYTDSENEEDKYDDDTDASTESQVIIPVQKKQEPPPPETVTEKPVSKSKKKKALRLVSYNDDTIISDEEDNKREITDEEDDSDNEEEEEVGDVEMKSGEEIKSKAESEAAEDSEKENKGDKFSEYGFNLPAEAKGKCAPELQEKINHLYEKMKNTTMDMNKVIQERKEFRNPSIYEKLIQFCDINELGTNYPPEIYDPLQWGPESFYEELAKAQKLEMDKREKEKKENSKVEMALAAAKKVEEEAKKRKSKWDQPGPSVGSAAQAGIKPAGLVQPSLTTNITGTKGTVISAFGSLPKKPKV